MPTYRTRFPLAFQGKKRLRVGGHVDEVVHLHEVHALHAHAAKRGLHLPDALLAAARPDLGRHEELSGEAELDREIADHGLGGAVHWRGIDQAPTGFMKRAQDFSQRRRGAATHVEGLPGADADDGQRFA
jgi:hypothetical protein